MLDTAMKSQLQAYLQNLRSPIRLIATLDASEKSAELRELLQEIAELSDKVSLDESGTDARKPSFVVAKEGETTGVRFAAIPLGHEFTSLVLALLWTGGHPPKVEAEVLDHIKALSMRFVSPQWVGYDAPLGKVGTFGVVALVVAGALVLVLAVYALLRMMGGAA